VPRSLRGSSNGRSSPGSLVSASARDAGNRCVAGGPDELPEGASVTTSEVAGNRTGGRRTAVLTLDRAIPDRPSSSLFELTAVPAARERLRMGLAKARTRGRALGARQQAKRSLKAGQKCGLRPSSLKSPMLVIRHGVKRHAPTLSPSWERKQKLGFSVS